VSVGHRPVAVVIAGVAHIASGCVTIVGAVAIAYAGFVPTDPRVVSSDFFMYQVKPGRSWTDLDAILIEATAFLVISLVVALCAAALGVAEVRIGRRAMQGTGYFAAVSFGIAWCILSFLLANYAGFLLAGVAAVSAWLARDWFREVDFAARDEVWSTPHRFKDWTLPDAPEPQAPSTTDPDQPELPPD